MSLYYLKIIVKFADMIDFFFLAIAWTKILWSATVKVLVCQRGAEELFEAPSSKLS